MVCQRWCVKMVCNRWCETKWCVKDGVIDGVSKMVCVCVCVSKIVSDEAV